MTHLRSDLAEQQPTRVLVTAQGPGTDGIAVDYDRLAAEIAARLGQARGGGGAAEVPVPPPTHDDGAAATQAADAVAPYLGRSDLTAAVGMSSGDG